MLKVNNFNIRGEPIELSEVTLSEELSKQILVIVKESI